jgi:hypothetical protein
MDCQTCRRKGLGFTPDLTLTGVTPIVVENGAGGIGDGILGLLAVSTLNKKQPVTYRVGESALPFVSLFEGYSRLGKSSKIYNEAPVRDAIQINADQHVEEAEGLASPRWERYRKNINASGLSIPRLKDPDGVRRAGEDLEGYVIMAPCSRDSGREWAIQQWLTLESLLLSAGYRTAAVHKTEDRIALFRGKHVANSDARRVTGVLLNAACVIGTDSGLTHVAAILGTKTIALGGNTDVAKIFGAYPHVTCIQGDLICSNCFAGRNTTTGRYYGTKCASACANLQSVSPARVMAEVDNILLRAVVSDDKGSRTLISLDRLRVIRDLVRRTDNLPGDLAELGVAAGGSAKLIRHYGKGHLHVFDTFSGIPQDDAYLGGQHKAGDFSFSEENVKSFLGAADITYHVGEFPSVLPAEDTRYRFVHVDGDTYQTTKAALAYFVPRMVPGGTIVLDDFEWRACPGVAAAITETNLPVVSLARYQAVLTF